MHKRACLFFMVTLLLAPLSGANPIAVGDKTKVQFEDLNRGQYRVYEPKNSPGLQMAMDQAVTRIAGTAYGRSIIGNILDCSATQIANYLGVSSQKALALAKNCRPMASPNVLANHAPVKGKHQRHEYLFVVTDSEFWPYDGWTNSSLGRSYLMFRQNSKIDELNLEYLTHLLAHEFAILFDERVSFELETMTARSPTLKKPEELKLVRAAFSNPLVQHVLSAIRAFQVEESIKQELAATATGSLDLFLSPVDGHEGRCDEVCLEAVVVTKAQSLVDLAEPLLAFSESYRHVTYERYKNQVQVPTANGSPMDALFVWSPMKYSFGDIAGSKVEDFLKMLSIHNPRARFFGTDPDVEFFRKNFLEPDLAVIQKFRFLLPRMAEPLLGGGNVGSNIGPRPRVTGN